MHVHTTYSDGLLTPNEVLKFYSTQKIKSISITDHNTIDGLIEGLKFNKNYDIELINGIEFDVLHRCKIHILSYHFDIKNIELNKMLNRIKEKKIKDTYIFYKQLIKLGLNTHNLDLKSITISKVSDLLVNQGFADTKIDAYKKYFEINKPLYFNVYKIPIEEAMSVIKKSGGISVLAHPIRITKNIDELESILVEFLEYNIDGIECFHPEHSINYTNELLRLTNKYKLKITGGSDFHYISPKIFYVNKNKLVFT